MAATADALGIPYPEPTVPQKPFSSFKFLSFDIYGTLIDWESSIIEQLSPKLTSQIPSTSIYKDAHANTEARLQLATLFNEYEHKVQAEHPELKYSDVLREVYLLLAQKWNIEVSENVKSEAVQFGLSCGDWKAFPDTVDAMKRLGKYFKMAPLSNVDRESFSRTNSGPLNGVNFWRVYTAQDIGSYKPDLKNFEYLLKKANEDDISEGGSGIKKEDVLHVAQSLFHDHRPAKLMGMSSVWINRAGAGMGGVDGVKQVHERQEVGYGWRYPTLAAFADEVERQLGENA